MELRFFNLRRLRRITDRYRNFQTFLGDVLDGERSLVQNSDTPSEMSIFELQDHVEDILQHQASRGSQPRKIDARMGNVFESLAPYFEAGLLLQTGDESGTRLKEMFVAGRLFVSPQSLGESLRLPVPTIATGAVAKARSRPILHLVQLDALHRLRDTSAFLITPFAGWSILLFCSRPHPWQVDFIERTRNAVMKVLELRSPKGRFGREKV